MKKEIVERLLKAGHIDFDEALVLMKANRHFMTGRMVQPGGKVSGKNTNMGSRAIVLHN